MATQNLIIQKLQERIGRINDMVRIGNPLPDSSSSSQTKQIPPGHRFIHAAKQMRILDKKKLGNIQPEDLSQTGRSLTTKFENVNQLLRLPLKSKSDSSFWSNVDKTYYSQASGESREAPPKQAGTFQRGSVIQKHSMFPSEGQSLENFLQQSKKLSQKSQTKSSTPRQAAPKRRPPTPNERLYSRVEEVTKDKPAEITPKNIPTQTPPPPAQKQKPVEQPKSSKPAESAKTALPSADIKQPQPPKFELRETKSTQKDAPTTSSKPASPPPSSTPTPKKPSTPSTDTQTPPSLEAAPKKDDLTTPPPQASKKPTPPMAQTKPKVKSAPKSVQRQLAKPKPQSPSAKAPSTAPKTKEKSTGQTPPDITTSPQKSTRAEAEAPFAQESKPRVAAPPPQMDIPQQRKFSTPSKIEDGESQKQSTPPSKEISPADAPKSKKADLPLQDQITKRHKQPNKFLSLDKEILKPSIKPKNLPISTNTTKSDSSIKSKDLPIFTNTIKPNSPTKPKDLPTFTNTITPNSTSTPPKIPAAQDRSMPKLPTEFEAFAPARGLSPQTVLQAPAPSKPKMPESMQPLQMEFPKKQTMPAPTPAEPEKTKPAAEKRETQSTAPLPTNVPSPAPANTVQRMIDTTVPEIEKNITGAAKGLMGRQNEKESATAPQVDLDALAKDMLPMIKRLLEIEAERSSRFFR